jgi:hypothetical protein
MRANDQTRLIGENNMITIDFSAVGGTVVVVKVVKKGGK